MHSGLRAAFNNKKQNLKYHGFIMEYLKNEKHGKHHVKLLLNNFFLSDWKRREREIGSQREVHATEHMISKKYYE